MFDLKGLMETRYNRISIAGKEDNAAILKFVSTIAMDTEALHISYVREPDFFNFFAEQGEFGATFLFKNDDGSIGGLCTITSRQCQINGRRVLFGYAGDLRVSPHISRKARIHWRKVFIEIIANYRTIKEIGCPDYMFSVIIDGNTDANKALVKPDGNPLFRKLIDFDSINIFGQASKPVCNLLNSRRLSQSGYSCRWATNSDFSAIKEFLYQENKGKQLGTNYPQKTAGELERRLAQWNNFAIDSFLLLERDGKITACLAPWSNGSSRRLVIQKAPLHLQTLGAIMPLWGKKQIKVNSELTTLYLTCVEIDSSLSMGQRTQIMGFMLDFLYTDKRWNQYHLVSFLSSDNCNLSPAVQGRGYLYTKQKSTLYQVLSPAENLAERYLTVADGELLGFDLATA